MVEAAAAGGGSVQAEYGPMDTMSSQLVGQARKWSASFATKLTTCGNPTLDEAISALGGSFQAAASQLSGASAKTGQFVSTVSSNFKSADGQ